MTVSTRDLLLKKIQGKKRNAASKDAVLNELDFLSYPQHSTALYTISNVQEPEHVVIYSYGGYLPHLFHYTDDNVVEEHVVGQFTWDWIGYWVERNIAVVIMDMPDFYKHSMFVPSLYRYSNGRKRECLDAIDLVSKKFPSAKLTWAGFSFGCSEASTVSLEDTKLDKIVVCSGTWHLLDGFDEWHQGARLHWYDVEHSKKPVLIVQHTQEKFEKATEQMTKTDSITVSNSEVSKDDGHFFKNKERSVAHAIIDWIQDKPYPKEIL